MERRVLFAIFLSFLVLYAYQAFVVKPTPKPATSNAAAAPSSSPATPHGTAPPASPEAPAVPLTRPVNASPLVADTVERDVVLENADVVATLTNRGARLKSWRLKRYHDASGQPQELVENGAPVLPFTLRTPDAGLNDAANAALFNVSGSGLDRRFEFTDGSGVSVVKTFHLDPSSYIVTVGASVTRDRDKPVAAGLVWGPGPGDVSEATRGTQPAEGLLYVDGGVQRLSASDIAKQPARQGDFGYVGVDDNYFMVVALRPGPATVTFQPMTIPPPPNSRAAARPLVSFTLEPQRAQPMAVFVGPKDFDLLTAMGPELAKAVNFGRFAFIVVPLLRSLKWINGYIGNWGWSIVILTVLINLIIAPLRHKQVVSMRKMQEIQPEVKAIQDRYAKVKATDPAKQKMNEEMMALYREKKVNPAAGCIPMLLTLPLVYAMWAMLQTSIELRGAPWMMWIHDLSARDPYYILPGLMVGTQLWQSMIMPAAGADPAQQRMMQIVMPIVFGFIFLFLPAGALLYYVVGTLFGVGQQYLTNYFLGPPPQRTVRPAAERRLKNKNA